MSPNSGIINPVSTAKAATRRKGAKQMTKPIARFQLMNGLSGCYMPDHHSGPYVVTTRREMVNAFRDQLEFLEMPKSLIRDIRWTKVWAHVKRHGASSLHLSVSHKGYSLELCGLTEDEAREMEAAQDF